MPKGRRILNTAAFNLTLRRLVNQLIEEHDTFENTCIIGIQPRGALFSNRLIQVLKQEMKNVSVEYGLMDITFHRDDFRLRKEPLQPYPTTISFTTEGKKVILVDDVLYSGRTIQAALSALNHFGRPDKVELLALVNRRFNRHLPIAPDYVGIQVDAMDEAYVKVQWKEDGTEDAIMLYSPIENK